MADRKITDLTALTTPASNDVLPIVDVSEAAAVDKNKKITVEELLRGAPNGTAAAPSFAFESDGGNGLYLAGTDTVGISTNGTGRLFVDASGRVGVGTASPAAAVDAVAESTNGFGVRIRGRASDGFGALQFTSNDGSSQTASLGVASSNTIVVSAGASERLRITSDGKVGVGTSSVNALLEVNSTTAGNEVQRIEGSYSGTGSVTLTNWRRAGGAVAAAFKYNDGTSPLCMSLGTTTSHQFRIRTADTDAITIDTSQRVGIGTSSVQAPLHVLGAATVSSVGDVAAKLGRTGDSAVLIGSTDGNKPFIASEGAYPLYLRTNNQNALAIDSSQRVGIGTTTITGFSDYTTVQLGSSSSGSALRLVASGDTPGTDDFVIYKNTSGSYLRSYGDPIVFFGNSSEYGRWDTSGRLLIGTSTSTSVSFYTAKTQIANAENANLSLHGYSTYTQYGADIIFTRSRSGSIGTNTIVQNGDQLARLFFAGANGTGYDIAAFIGADVDGVPGASGDMPGRIVLATTADGASSPTERMRISNNGVVTIKNGAVAEIGTLTDGATITPNFASNCNFTVTLGGARTIANPTNVTAGQSGSIFIVQDATGGRTASWGSNWDWAGGTAPTLSTGANAVDRVDYICRSATSIHAVYTGNYS